VIPSLPSFIRPPLRLGFTLLASGLALSSCLAPTEIRLHVHTNLPCTDPSAWHGVAVYVGEPGTSLEDKAPALTSAACDESGQIGSLVLVPSGSKDEEIGLRVVAGVNSNPEECVANHYSGCVVARRTVRFNRHSTLDLDVDLTEDCVGLGCDALHTCQTGSCTDTRVVDVPSVDGSDAGQLPPRVRCGDSGLFCPTTGNVCCLTADREAKTAFGVCEPASDCPPTSSILNCDDETDCVRPDGIGLCVVSYTRNPATNGVFTPYTVTSTQCMDRNNYVGQIKTGVGMCQARVPCDGRFLCHEPYDPSNNPLPGYFQCDLTY